MSTSKINTNGILLTVFGMCMSTSLGILSFNFFPRVNVAICNYVSPIAPFEGEGQWAKSVDANDQCLEKSNNFQLVISSLLFFTMYIQIIRSLILASYLYQKYLDKNDKNYEIDNSELYVGYLSNLFEDKKEPKFENLEQLKASYLIQKEAVDGFIKSYPIENTDKKELDITDQKSN